ncbi:MAG: hypothetical protein ACTHOM_16915 [Allomuricauda sp.]
MDIKFNSAVILALTCILVGCSQAQNQSAEELLRDPNMQDAIMENIASDHQMMMNMMGHMVNNEHAMQMMAQNQDMMHSMMGNRQAMMNMMMKDSTFSNMMMGNMLEMMEQDSAFGSRMSHRMMGNQHMMDMMEH